MSLTLYILFGFVPFIVLYSVMDSKYVAILCFEIVESFILCFFLLLFRAEENNPNFSAIPDTEYSDLQSIPPLYLSKKSELMELDKIKDDVLLIELPYGDYYVGLSSLNEYNKLNETDSPRGTVSDREN